MKDRLEGTIDVFSWIIIILLIIGVGSNEIYAQERPLNLTDCNPSLKQVQNELFPLNDGSKHIVTYSVTGFDENEECWRSLETVAKSITEDSEIAGVYFFTLPPDEISKINMLHKDFNQYGMNLIATYWKDPDSGTELKRYPNTTIDGR